MNASVISITIPPTYRPLVNWDRCRLYRRVGLENKLLKIPRCSYSHQWCKVQTEQCVLASGVFVPHTSPSFSPFPWCSVLAQKCYRCIDLYPTYKDDHLRAKLDHLATLFTYLITLSSVLCTKVMIVGIALIYLITYLLTYFIVLLFVDSYG